MMIKLRHFRELGHCRRGVQALAESYGIDYEQLRTTGVDESVIKATGNEMAERVVEHARQESDQ
jgi:hypothetical protein